MTNIAVIVVSHFFLMAYQPVAVSGDRFGENGVKSAWQNLGEFQTEQMCEEARQSLGKPALMRCVKSREEVKQ